jgi:hypothetical protein
MLTGELPGERLQPPSSRLRGLQIDVRLDEIVLRALEKAPEMRFQTAADLRTQVETVVTHATASAKANPAFHAPPRPLKVGMTYAATPGQLSTFEGRFFLHRTNTQLLLDERQLSFALATTPTSIPLPAIRDLSIGHFPRMMNPAGIDYISVSYETGRETSRVLLTPNEGLIGSPRHVNRLVAEWFTAIQVAVKDATGAVPASTPAEQLTLPFSRIGGLTMWMIILLPVAIPFLIAFVLAGPSHSMTPIGATLFGFVILGLLAVLYRHSSTRVPQETAPRKSSRSLWGWLALGVVSVVGLAMVMHVAVVLLVYATEKGTAIGAAQRAKTPPAARDFGSPPASP